MSSIQARGVVAAAAVAVDALRSVDLGSVPEAELGDCLAALTRM